MEKLIAAIFIVITVLAHMHLDNNYLRADTFTTLTVQPGDSLHDLAGRYSIKENDRAKFIVAVCEINGLYADSDLRAGRQLQIPVLARDADNAIARK